MMQINIIEDIFELKSITKYDFKEILELYNSEKDFRLATGIDNTFTMRDLYKKYNETLVSESEFFSGIYLKDNNEFIGAIRGGFNLKHENSLWINSIIIAKKHQHKGYGTKVINMIEEYFSVNYDIGTIFISVLEINANAKRFWTSGGFVELRKMEGSIYIDNKKQEIIIMRKELNNKVQISQ